MTISTEAVVRNQRLSSLKREIGVLEHREQLTTAQNERLAEIREAARKLEIERFTMQWARLAPTAGPSPARM